MYVDVGVWVCTGFVCDVDVGGCRFPPFFAGHAFGDGICCQWCYCYSLTACAVYGCDFTVWLGP